MQEEFPTRQNATASRAGPPAAPKFVIECFSPVGPGRRNFFFFFLGGVQDFQDFSVSDAIFGSSHLCSKPSC